jgi:signal transduction histidine kinase
MVLPRHSQALRRTAVLAPPLVVLLFAGLLFDGIQRRRAITARVQQTQQVVSDVQHIMTQVANAETGHRGYLIVGEPEYLEPYHGASGEARGRIAALRVALAADSVQLARLHELERLVDERFAIFEDVLAARQRDGPEAGRVAMMTRSGHGVMERLRAVTRAVTAHEESRLERYTAAQERASRLLLLTLVAGSLVVIAVAVLTNVLFRRQLSVQERLNDDLAYANTRLQEQALELEMQTQELQTQALHLEDTALELEASNDELQRQGASLESLAAQTAAANEELQRVNRILEERTAEAERANRGKTEFLAAMSHELRTPLNAITGYIDLLQLEVYGTSSAGQQKALERIRSNARHLLVLINDILHFAKIQAGHIELRSTAVSLDALLAETDTVMAPLVRARNITFERRNEAAGVAVLGDQHRIRQILVNLLSNAVKYTESGGRVTLSTVIDGERVRIQVRDTGAGIPPDMLDVIFDPFVQLQRGPGGELTDGVGLGLSISRELAEAMTGDLVVESSLGGGSTFTLTLPRGGPHESTAAPRSEIAITKHD